MAGLLGNLMSPLASDLGLGQNLADQVGDETEEEKRRKRLGLGASDAVNSLFGYGRPTGLATTQLGLGKGAGRY